MALIKTKLVLVAAQLPADFSGTPQEFFEALVKRLEIMSPAGTNFFVTGDVAPSTNQGPWLKSGTQWWVWSTSEGQYVPLDISESAEHLFTVSDNEPDAPTGDDANIWLRTKSGRVIAWYFWNGEIWRPGGNRPASGATADRPNDPQDLEQFFDTDINALIHYERNLWRTVSGVPGDIKFVTTPTLTAALTNNPGWKYLGDAPNQSYIGRVLGIASKDPGGSPESAFTVDSGITARASGDTAGAETHVLDSDEIQQHTHLFGALTALGNSKNFHFYRVDNGDEFEAPAPKAPNYAKLLGGNGSSEPGELPAAPTGTMLVTSKQLSIEDAGDDEFTEAAEPHNNIQPTLFLWALTKE